MRVVVASYNIHSCVGQDGRYDPERVLTVIRELNADIVALQEVDSREHRGLELLRCFGAELGLEPIAGPTLLRDTGHYGNGILTRYAAKDVRRIDLSFPKREPRGALDVDLECAGHLLQVVATHLGLRPSERRAQVRRVMDRCRTKYCILMGDLNEWFLWGRPLRWLKSIFGPTPHLQTFPARFPVFALDRIWMHPRSAMRSIEVHRTKSARLASDHLPIKAVIEL
jgi:endonuclease/exonuclease/phosphatase family metal-dependent hydrolase